MTPSAATSTTCSARRSRANRGEAYGYYFLKHELARCDVGLEFLDQAFVDDGESEIGALMESLQALLPSIDKRTIMRRFARGKRRVVDEGFSWVGTAPYGYDYTPGGQHKHSWAKVPEEVPHVVDIFTWAAEGLSRTEICRRLQDRGAKTRKGGQWWPSTVRGIIANPRYKGEFPIGRYQMVRAGRPYESRPSRPSTGQQGAARRKLKTALKLVPRSEWQKTVQRPELAIVSAELWQRANDMAARDLATPPRRARYPRLLQGMVYCEHDHGAAGPIAMRLWTHKTWTPRYLCRWRASVCSKQCGASIQAPELEQRVWELVCALCTEPERLLSGFVAGYAEFVERQRRWRAQLEAARAEVRKYEETLDRLQLAYYSGELAPDRYERLRAMAEEHLRSAKEQCKRAEAETSGETGGEMDPLAALLLALSGRFAGSEGGQVSEEQIRASIRTAVRALLGHVTRGELKALDLEGRRRKVRQIVERVVLGPKGPSAVLVLGGGRVDFTDEAGAGCARRTGRGSGAGPGRVRGRRGG
jgi:DNA invertase Pin-like site-specific DNA recombinase